jgi:hypothetical protein
MVQNNSLYMGVTKVVTKKFWLVTDFQLIWHLGICSSGHAHLVTGGMREGWMTSKEFHSFCYVDFLLLKCNKVITIKLTFKSISPPLSYTWVCVYVEWYNNQKKWILPSQLKVNPMLRHHKILLLFLIPRMYVCLLYFQWIFAPRS